MLGLFGLLLAIPCLLLFAAKEPGWRGALGHREWLPALETGWAAHRSGLSWQQFAGPELTFRLLVTSAAGMLASALLMLMPKLHAAWVRVVLGAAMALLALAPTAHLAATHGFLIARAEHIRAGAALFESRCRQAGASKIRMVEGEAGARLTSIRSEASEQRFADRLWAGAGMPRDRVGEAHIALFFDFQFDASTNPAWSIGDGTMSVTMPGFDYVDAELAGGGYVRYRRAGQLQLLAEPIEADQAARYAVSYTPNDLPGDREHWVAGATVTVTDTHIGEVLGELRVYRYAPPIRGTGKLAQRSWHQAHTCPDYKDIPDAMTRMFVD